MPNKLFPSRIVGDFSVTAISDGYIAASLEFLSNIDPVDASRMQHDAGIEKLGNIHINCYLVRGGGRTILIDGGTGGLNQWGGCLKDNLSLAAVEPTDIDVILLTHGHPDHVGGLTDALGKKVFPNAELCVHQREVAFWQDDGNLNRVNERARGNFLIARRALDGYRANLRVFDDGEVVPGIHAMPFPGHTEGHTGFRIDSGGQSLLVWGDIVHFPHIQIARPDVAIAFDHDPLFAVATRSKLLDMVSSEKLLIGGMHLGEAAFARVKCAARGYGFLYEDVESH